MERRAALLELRSVLADLRDSGGKLVDAVRLARVRDRLGAAGVAIDLDAAEILGAPMVVVQMGGRPAPCFDVLTPREREVAELVASGLRNKDIALALGLSLGTVKDHVHHILSKTGLDGRAQVVAAWRSG